MVPTIRIDTPTQTAAARVIRIPAVAMSLIEKYPEHRESIPTFVALLRDDLAGVKIRREAASTLGVIGVSVGDAEAIQALGVHGLVDPDPSVRVISATQLGRVKGELAGKVVDFLRMRVGEAESVARVRMAAARSLLKLRRADGVADLAGSLAADEFWKEVVRYAISVRKRFFKQLPGHHPIHDIQPLFPFGNLADRVWRNAECLLDIFGNPYFFQHHRVKRRSHT